MFPQSELDNYKLQVELLQEKLQRSEISRKYLEQKLDKILQKRDEHDKLVRSKARQKYQEFLEEQQRRNERNKQLVQMLERIEQQTEAMNARSERLKMMKLQYEMYFAKLVHSQTKRCIQSSISPVTQMMMPTPSSQPTQTTLQQPAMEGYNYVTNHETPTTFMFNPCPPNAITKTNLANESFVRMPSENMSPKTMEIPTLANFARAERNDGIDFRNLNDGSGPLPQTQQLYQQQVKREPINNNLVIPTSIDYNTNKHEMPDDNFYSKINADNMSQSSLTNLSPNDKLLTEYAENSNLSTTASSTFEELSNVAMMSPKSHNINKFPNTTTTITKTYNGATNNNATSNNNANFQTLQNTQDVIESPSQFRNQKDTDSTSDIQERNIVNSIPQSEENEIKNPVVHTVNELKTHDITMPRLQDKTLTSLASEPRKVALETSPNSINNTNFVIQPPEPTKQIESESLANNTELNYSTTPVSIENIENKIYGELLSPLENEELEKPENPNVIPKLMENLVTQAENIVTENIPTKEPTVNHVNAANTNPVDESTVNGEENLVTSSNYEETTAFENYDNEQPPEDLANSFPIYTNNNDNNNEIDESQQQQYDYSNYDPTQYSYPGYIYDETTGEYKPDPNASAEQYATDQQYTSEDYDQQYQQKDYDYNQTYAEDPTTSTTTAESTVYNNYDTTQQEISSNITPADTNPQAITKPEPNDFQPDLASEEVPTSSGKVTKPTSILSTADKNDSQKKKKRVNFIDSSETDESAVGDKLSATKPTAANLGGSSESDFDFSSSTEGAGSKATSQN